MISKKKLRFGLVGAGAIAQAYVQAVRRCEAAEIVGVADVRSDAAEAIANSLECGSFSCHRAMADSLALDAAIVCTPPVSHPEICIDLLRRGLHVVCEKPLAIDPESARRMIETAGSRGLKLTMASKFRHVDDMVRAKAIVTSGILGEIVLFENVFTSRVDMSNRWNSDAGISGGGVLIDNGTHSVDIMRFFLGPLAELQVVEGKRLQSLSVEDTVRVFVKSVGGVLGSIDLSWSVNKEQPHYVGIYGSQGTVLVGWKESKYRRCSDDDWIVFGNGYDKIGAFRRQIDGFADAIRGEAALVVTPEDAMASVEVIEAAYQALDQSTWIPIANGRKPKRRTARQGAGEATHVA